MNLFKRILIVSRMTPDCRTAVHCGVIFFALHTGNHSYLVAADSVGIKKISAHQRRQRWHLKISKFGKAHGE